MLLLHGLTKGCVDAKVLDGVTVHGLLTYTINRVRDDGDIV